MDFRLKKPVLNLSAISREDLPRAIETIQKLFEQVIQSFDLVERREAETLSTITTEVQRLDGDIGDHSADQDPHTQYLLVDGTRNAALLRVDTILEANEVVTDADVTSGGAVSSANQIIQQGITLDDTYSPLVHTHTVSELTDGSTLATDAELAAGLATKANTSHTHVVADLTDGSTLATDAELASGLAGKANTSHSHLLADVTDAGTAAARTVGVASGSQIPDRDAADIRYSAAAHTHEWTGLDDTPDDYNGDAGKPVIVKGSEDGLEFGSSALGAAAYAGIGTSAGTVSAGDHTHDDRYYRENEHLSSSAGAADAGKPIVLDAGGHVDASMLNDADIDHGSIGGLTDPDHPVGAIAFTATDKLLGRSTAGAGAGEEITCTAAGRALLDDANAAAQLVTLGAAASSHTHDDRYFTESEHIDAETGGADGGKPIKLNSSGEVGVSLLPTGTTSTSVALGNHAHGAGDYTALANTATADRLVKTDTTGRIGRLLTRLYEVHKPACEWVFFDDFERIDSHWQQANTGSGASFSGSANWCPIIASENAIGAFRSDVGASGGSCALYHHYEDIMRPASGLEYWVRFYAGINTGTAGTVLRFGLGDGTGASSPSNGIFFEFAKATSNNWLRCTANGGSSTKTDTSFAVTGSTTYTFRFVYNGSNIDFYYSTSTGESKTWTSLGSNSTNVPGNTRYMRPFFYLSHTVAWQSLDVDYVWCWREVTR